MLHAKRWSEISERVEKDNEIIVTIIFWTRKVGLMATPFQSAQLGLFK